MQEMNEPLVSIILPVYRPDARFGLCLRSIALQEYRNYEVLVIDDSGIEGDQIQKMVDECFDGNYILIKNIENVGAGCSRRRGVGQAKGKYIAFIDSDDCWLPKKLTLQISHMERYGFSVTGHGYQQLLDIDSMDLIDRAEIKHRRIKGAFLLFRSFVATPTLIFRKDALVHMTDFRRCDDIVMLYASLRVRNDDCIVLPHCLAFGFKSSKGEGGLTESLGEMHKAVHGAYQHLLSLKLRRADIFMIRLAILVEIIKFPIRYTVVRIRRAITAVLQCLI